MSRNLIPHTTRIALFMPAFALGGVQRVMLLLAGGIAERGIPVDLLVARAEGQFLDAIPERVRLINLNAPMTILSLPALLRYMHRERPDVLISALSTVIPAVIAKKLFFRRVRVLARQDATMSIFRHIVTTRSISGLKLRAALRLIQHAMPHVDGIVCVSHGVAEDLRKVIPRAAHLVHTIYNPVVSDRIAKSAAASPDHPWFDDTDMPVILSVGRLVASKDHPTLLRAFARVLGSRPARLVILGEGPNRNMLTSLADELGIAESVDLPGFTANPFAYMARSRVFALSSSTEGLPTALIEAMACGAPIVSTDCPSGPREISRTAGGAGWCRLAIGDPWVMPSWKRWMIPWPRKSLLPRLKSSP